MAAACREGFKTAEGAAGLTDGADVPSAVAGACATR